VRTPFKWRERQFAKDGEHPNNAEYPLKGAKTWEKKVVASKTVIQTFR